MRASCWAVLAFLVALSLGAERGVTQSKPEGPGFAYVLEAEPGFIEAVETERLTAEGAAFAQRAEAWALTVSLLLEMAHGAAAPADKALALDAALEELTSWSGRSMLERAPATRIRALRASLARFDARDPAGFREHASGLVRSRIDVLERVVLDSPRPESGLDSLLSQHGWVAAGGTGPLGRQRAEDRSDFRVIGRHDVHELDGMVRRHAMLPPTEARQGVPLDELGRKVQRSRNFARRIESLWDHKDGPRLHDFIVDLALRDATGIVRLVHADSVLLAQHDRLRRWRLREAIWRLEAAAN